MNWTKQVDGKVIYGWEHALTCVPKEGVVPRPKRLYRHALQSIPTEEQIRQALKIWKQNAKEGTKFPIPADVIISFAHLPEFKGVPMTHRALLWTPGKKEAFTIVLPPHYPLQVAPIKTLRSYWLDPRSFKPIAQDVYIQVGLWYLAYTTLGTIHTVVYTEKPSRIRWEPTSAFWTLYHYDGVSYLAGIRVPR